MGVPAVGPEEEQPVEQRADVGHVGPPLGKDPEDAAVLLIKSDNNDQLSVTSQEGEDRKSRLSECLTRSGRRTERDSLKGQTDRTVMHRGP